MTNINEFNADLERAQRGTVIDLLRSHRDVTLAELAALRDTHGDLVGSITLDELISGQPGTSKRRRRGLRRKKAAKGTTSGRRPGRPRKVDTRTAAGREAYDEAMLAAAIGQGDSASADQLRALIGGTSEQARSSLARLVDAKQVKRMGRGRGTRYQAR